MSFAAIPVARNAFRKCTYTRMCPYRTCTFYICEPAAADGRFSAGVLCAEKNMFFLMGSFENNFILINMVQ